MMDSCIALQAEVAGNDNKKNINLLKQASALSRMMGAGRTICCKSAKDRTSMSISWEQGTMLKARHDVSEARSNRAIDLMREHGVRRLNVIKNTGKSLYAFNSLQRQCLP